MATAASSSPSPLDFSLKPSPSKRPRLASAGSTHTSPGSSPHSSHSPSSTTLPYSQASTAADFSPASSIPPYPHFLNTSVSGMTGGIGSFAGLFAQSSGSLLQPNLSALAPPLHHPPGPGMDLQSVFGNSWLGGGGGAGNGGDSSLFNALSALRRRKPVKTETPPPMEMPPASTPSPKKTPQGVPDEKKDALYWERRRKNNEAAKRSRDTRRRKEEEVALRAAILEQENLKLRAQVAVLKNETAKLHLLLFSNTASAATPPALGPSTETPTITPIEG